MFEVANELPMDLEAVSGRAKNELGKPLSFKIYFEKKYKRPRRLVKVWPAVKVQMQGEAPWQHV